MVIALCEYMVQLPILSLATPIFPTKQYYYYYYYWAVSPAGVLMFTYSMRQCSSYSGHTHLQLVNRVIHFNTEVECLARVWLCLETPIWFALERLQNSGGLRLDLHLWARINKTKIWKFSKKIFANTLRFVKFANIFFRELFPLYGICLFGIFKITVPYFLEFSPHLKL